jgi:RHS repeat-associated protein
MAIEGGTATPGSLKGTFVLHELNGRLTPQPRRAVTRYLLEEFSTRDSPIRTGASLPQILQDTYTVNSTASTTLYLYGLNGLIATTDGSGTTRYYLQDGPGSTAQLTDTTGAVTDNYTYDVFGAVTAHTGAGAQPFTYTGQQQDASANRGLVYLRARMCDPALGRFLTKDPLRFMQRYAYAGDDPVNYVDPSGQCSIRHPARCAKNAAATVVSATRYTAGAVQSYCAKADCVQVALDGAAVISLGAGIATGDPALVYAGTALYTGQVEVAWLGYQQGTKSRADVWTAVAGGIQSATGAELVDLLWSSWSFANSAVCEPFPTTCSGSGLSGQREKAR